MVLRVIHGIKAIAVCSWSLTKIQASFLWQLVVPKTRGGPLLRLARERHFRRPATVEGDRVYIVSNRGEGHLPGCSWNGQRQTRARIRMKPRIAFHAKRILPNQRLPIQAHQLTGHPRLESVRWDADILWLFDFNGKAPGIWSHDGRAQLPFLYTRRLSVSEQRHRR